jgi:hypothetical protein
MSYQSRPISSAPQPWQYVPWPAGSWTLPVNTWRSPAPRAIRRAVLSAAGGVAGVSRIFQSGWKAVKCSGTSGPRRSATQRLNASTSAAESFSPGISSVVISNHTPVSCFRYSRVSSTGARRAEHRPL